MVLLLLLWWSRASESKLSASTTHRTGDRPSRSLRLTWTDPRNRRSVLVYLYARELRQGTLTSQSRANYHDPRRDITRPDSLWCSWFMYVTRFSHYCGPRSDGVDFFTFSLIAFGFFPLVTKLLGDRPHAVERLTRGYLAILAICDVGLFTLLPYESELTTDRSNSEPRDACLCQAG